MIKLTLIPVQPLSTRTSQAFVSRSAGRCGWSDVETSTYPLSEESATLEHVRIAADLSLGDVGRLVGLSAADISALERGRARLAGLSEWASLRAAIDGEVIRRTRAAPSTTTPR